MRIDEGDRGAKLSAKTQSSIPSAVVPIKTHGAIDERTGNRGE